MNTVAQNAVSVKGREVEATVDGAGLSLRFEGAAYPFDRTYMALEDAITVAKAVLSFADGRTKARLHAAAQFRHEARAWGWRGYADVATEFAGGHGRSEIMRGSLDRNRDAGCWVAMVVRQDARETVYATESGSLGSCKALLTDHGFEF